MGLDDARVSLDEAKAAYRARAMLLHPDAPGGDEAAFKRLQIAWDAVQQSGSKADAR